MSEQNERPYDSMMKGIAEQVQADFEAKGLVPGSTPVTQAPSAPASGAEAAPTPTPSTGGGDKLYAGKFKTIEEMEKAHHLLMHGFNALKAEQDKFLAQAASPPAATVPLSPGRVDPVAAPVRNDADNQKWVEQYGIDPADIDARVERKLTEARERDAIPGRLMQQADAYMAQAHPDFMTKVDEVKAFVAASPWLRERVATLWSNSLYAEAMEIGYLAYDNAVRTASIVGAAGAATNQAVGMQRGDAALLTSQAGGARELTPAPNAYPTTREDWERIRNMRLMGKEEEVRRILYAPLIAHIPELNPGMQR